MLHYGNGKGSTGAIGYDLDVDFIIVYFKKGTYKYPESMNEKQVIDKMKELAIAKEGLTTFINQHKPGYIVIEKK